MNKLTVLSIVLLLIPVNEVLSQISLRNAQDQMNYVIRESLLSESRDTYTNIKGSPYLTDEFIKGAVYTKGGDVFPGDYRFDIYSNKVQFMNQGVKYHIAAPDSIAKVEMGEYTLQYVEYAEDEDVAGKAYMIVLGEGNFTLLEKKSRVFYEALPAKPYQDPEPAKFGKGKDIFFLKAGDKPAEKITSTKDIIRICGDKGTAAKSYIDSEKLGVKQAEELILIVNHLNSLQ